MGCDGEWAGRGRRQGNTIRLCCMHASIPPPPHTHTPYPHTNRPACCAACCRPAVAYAAQQLPALVREGLEGFCALSTSSLADILCCPSLVGEGRLERGWEGGRPPRHSPALLKHLDRLTCSRSCAALPPAGVCSQACPEKAVFDGVMLWAGYGRQVEDASSPCHPLEVRWGCELVGPPTNMHLHSTRALPCLIRSNRALFFASGRFHRRCRTWTSCCRPSASLCCRTQSWRM